MLSKIQWMEYKRSNVNYMYRYIDLNKFFKTCSNPKFYYTTKVNIFRRPLLDLIWSPVVHCSPKILKTQIKNSVKCRQVHLLFSCHNKTKKQWQHLPYCINLWIFKILRKFHKFHTDFVISNIYHHQPDFSLSAFM